MDTLEPKKTPQTGVSTYGGEKMDSNTILLIAVIGIIVLVIVGLWLFRKGNVETDVKLPGGTGATFKGSQPQPPAQPRAVETGNIKAGKGAKVLDETEGGIKVGDVEAGEDVDIQAKARPPAEDPKEPPPT